jgi:hypothetical protein
LHPFFPFKKTKPSYKKSYPKVAFQCIVLV